MPTDPRDNIKLANRRRSQRARLKREIADNPALLEAALAMRPEWLGGAKLHDLLRSLRWVGHTRASEIMRHSQIDERARVRELSRRQVARVIVELRRRGDVAA